MELYERAETIRMIMCCLHGMSGACDLLQKQYLDAADNQGTLAMDIAQEHIEAAMTVLKEIQWR